MKQLKLFRARLPRCHKCGGAIRAAEYLTEPDGTARHLNACPVPKAARGHQPESLATRTYAVFRDFSWDEKEAN